MLFRLVITFLPRSKRLLISWLQSPSAVILEPRKIKSATVSPSICHEVMGPDAVILVFWMLSFKPAFSLSSFTFIKRVKQCLVKSKDHIIQMHDIVFLLAYPFYRCCVTSFIRVHKAYVYSSLGFPGGAVVKNLSANAGDATDIGWEDPLE